MIRKAVRALVAAATLLPVVFIASPAGAPVFHVIGATCTIGRTTTRVTSSPATIIVTSALAGCTNAPATGGKGTLVGTLSPAHVEQQDHLEQDRNHELYRAVQERIENQQVRGALSTRSCHRRKSRQ